MNGRVAFERPPAQVALCDVLARDLSLNQAYDARYDLVVYVNPKVGSSSGTPIRFDRLARISLVGTRPFLPMAVRADHDRQPHWRATDWPRRIDTVARLHSEWKPAFECRLSLWDMLTTPDWIRLVIEYQDGRVGECGTGEAIDGKLLVCNQPMPGAFGATAIWIDDNPT